MKRALNFFDGIIPKCYINNSEVILNSDRNVIWGLLNNIREAYVKVIPKTQCYSHLMNMKLPYSMEDTRKLEISIIKWLRKLNILRHENIYSILEILEEIRNGTLLCHLV